MVHYVVKLKGFDEQIARFKAMPKVIEKATVSALNKLGTQAVTVVKRAITDVYNVKSGDVAKAIDRVRAKANYTGKPGRLFTTITSEGRRISLHKFGGLPATPPSQAGIPVARRKTPTVKILKKGLRRPLTRDRATGNMPFVAQTKKGQVGFWVRTGEWVTDRRGSHEGIRFITRKGIPSMFSSVGKKAIVKLADEKGGQILQHELEYYFEKELKK